MSLFTVNHSEAGGFQTVTPGEYEVIFSKTEETVASTGSKMLKVQMTIRQDVDQSFQKQKLFDQFVVSEKAMFRFQQVAKALGFPEGEPIASLADFASKILYKPVRVKVKNEVYNGNTSARIEFYNQSNFEYEGGDAGGRDPFADDGRPLDISESDLPF